MNIDYNRQGHKDEDQLGGCEIISVKDNDSMEKQAFCEYILKMKALGFSGGFDVRYERNKEVKIH